MGTNANNHKPMACIDSREDAVKKCGFTAFSNHRHCPMGTAMILQEWSQTAVGLCFILACTHGHPRARRIRNISFVQYGDNIIQYINMIQSCSLWANLNMALLAAVSCHHTSTAVAARCQGSGSPWSPGPLPKPGALGFSSGDEFSKSKVEGPRNPRTIRRPPWDSRTILCRSRWIFQQKIRQAARQWRHNPGSATSAPAALWWAWKPRRSAAGPVGTPRRRGWQGPCRCPADPLSWKIPALHGDWAINGGFPSASNRHVWWPDGGSPGEIHGRPIFDRTRSNFKRG